MTDGHSLIYHSSTIPMAVISKGDLSDGDFVHLMEGILSTL